MIVTPEMHEQECCLAYIHPSKASQFPYCTGTVVAWNAYSSGSVPETAWYLFYYVTEQLYWLLTLSEAVGGNT